MKRKRILPALLLAVLLLGAACPPALGADTGRRVFDQADLLTPAQESGLEEDIAQFQRDTGMDFVLVTTRQPHEGVSVQTVADDFYDKYGFGLDEEHSGALYYIDLYGRDHYLSTTGKMIDIMTDQRIDSAISAAQPSLTAGDYAVLVSDGLLVDGAGWVAKQVELSAAAGDAPEKLAETLVETARIRAQKTGRPDDITAAVLRLEKSG